MDPITVVLHNAGTPQSVPADYHHVDADTGTVGRRICVRASRRSTVSGLRVRDAAALVGVSDDTVRRWVDSGVVASSKDSSGRTVVDGASLAAHSRERAAAPPDPSGTVSSARNRLAGLVTSVVVDTVMAEVQMQCGPFTVTSLMSAESVRTLGLEPGSVAVAVVKATTVIVETP